MTEMPRPDDDRLREAVLTVPDHVVYRSFEAETLLLNLQTGQYHGLNATGGRLLELLDESGGRLTEANGKLAAEVELDAGEVEPDMLSFCGDLAERGLIELADPPADERS